MTRTYIRVTYVALSHWGKPIASAHTQEDLKAGIDEYYGIGTDPTAKYLEWIPYDSKYPDEYEGCYKYECDEGDGNIVTETVKVYCIDFYPHTKYEVEDKQEQKQALIEMMKHDEELGLYDVDRQQTTMEGKYVIIDLRTMDIMKDKDGNIKYYDTEEEVRNVCGIYEFETAWVMKLVYNHIEEN